MSFKRGVRRVGLVLGTLAGGGFFAISMCLILDGTFEQTPGNFGLTVGFSLFLFLSIWGFFEVVLWIIEGFGSSGKPTTSG